MKDGKEPATRVDLQGVQSALKDDIREVRSDLKGDIGEIRSELKGDIGEIRSELKGDIGEVRSELKGDIARLDKKIDGVARGVVDLRAEVRQLGDSVPTKSDWNRLFANLDYIRGKVDDQDRTVVVFDKILRENRKTLENHERRIGSLEAKP